MDNRYVFDKRVLKKLFLKYGLILLGIFIILIPINSLLRNIMDNGIIWVDILIGLVIIFIVEGILDKLEKKREEKEQLRLAMEKKAKLQAKKELEQNEVIEVSDVKVRKGKNRQDLGKGDK